MRSGVRIGNQFLWLDVDTVEINDERVVVLTARKGLCNGDVIAREFATWEMVHSLRGVAKTIENAFAEVARPQNEEAQS